MILTASTATSPNEFISWLFCRNGSNNKLFSELCRQEAIEFGGTFAYNKSNTESKMDVPSIVFEVAERYYDTKYEIIK